MIVEIRFHWLMILQIRIGWLMIVLNLLVMILTAEVGSFW